MRSVRGGTLLGLRHCCRAGFFGPLHSGGVPANANAAARTGVSNNVRGAMVFAPCADLCVGRDAYASAAWPQRFYALEPHAADAERNVDRCAGACLDMLPSGSDIRG